MKKRAIIDLQKAADQIFEIRGEMLRKFDVSNDDFLVGLDGRIGEEWRVTEKGIWRE